MQHSVTIGDLQTDGHVPRVGENVFIGARAIVIGDVNVGNNVKIGAGSVVLKDVPNNCTVVGVPARIVRKE